MRRTRTGWPDWAIFIQIVVASVGISMVVLLDEINQLVSRTTGKSATRSVPAHSVDPTTLDNGSMALFVGPFLLLIVFVVVSVPTAVVLAFSLIVGLPIRHNRPVRAWWAGHFWISGSVAAVGGALALLAVVAFSAPPTPGPTFLYRPSSVLVVLAAVIVGFGLVHLWMPRKAATGK